MSFTEGAEEYREVGSPQAGKDDGIVRSWTGDAGRS